MIKREFCLKCKKRKLPYVHITLPQDKPYEKCSTCNSKLEFIEYIDQSGSRVSSSPIKTNHLGGRYYQDIDTYE